MILSKKNLLVVECISVDKQIPVLNNIHIAEDGSTVASSGRGLIAVSPVPDKIRKSVPVDDSGVDGGTYASETIKQVLKNLPRDVQFGGLLEFVDLKNGTFTLTDGKRKHELIGKPYDRKYIDYQDVIQKAFENISSGSRVVLNLKRLIALLQTVEKICGDSVAETPIYIEFTKENDVIIMGESSKTGQQVIALMNSYKGIEGKWIVLNTWAKKIIDKAKYILKIKKERR